MFKFAVLLGIITYVAGYPSLPLPQEQPIIDVAGDWRIVGGTNAPAAAYPFIVSLRTSGGNHFCGGTIINALNILTAAHCIIGRSTANTNIVAGTNTLLLGGVPGSSSRLIVHGSYNPFTVANDIAVIRLVSSFSWTVNIQQVGLNNVDTGAVPAILIGWGRLVNNGPISNNLQHLDTQTVTHVQCQQSWGASVSPLQICTVIGAGRGACEGDSGGPLIQTSNRAQIGIVSFRSTGGCAIGWPDVFTRVSSYQNWIISAVAS